MGHANVDTTLNVYTQVLDGSLREAVDKVGGGLFTIRAMVDNLLWLASRSSRFVGKRERRLVRPA